MSETGKVSLWSGSYLHLISKTLPIQYTIAQHPQEAQFETFVILEEEVLAGAL